MSSPKSVKPPPPPPPTALPSEEPEVEEEAIRKAKKASGYSKQILTGSLTPFTGKKKVLG